MMVMKELNASAFRQRCLALLDQLPADGILVTKRGKPVAKITPIRQDNREFIGILAGKLRVRGDIFSTHEKWDADQS